MAEASVEIPEGRQFIANSETRKRGSFYAFAAIGMVGKAAEAPGIDPDYYYIAGSGVMKRVLGLCTSPPDCRR
jgi:hypothetical protein